MAKIDVNIIGISNLSPKVRSARVDNLQTVKQNIINIRGGLDGRVASYKVAGKDTVANRLTWVHSSITWAEEDLEKIEAILKSAYKNYEEAESNLEKEVSDLNYKRQNSLSDFWSKYRSLFGNDSAFSSTHNSSSGRTHGGGGRFFDEKAAKSALKVLNEVFNSTKNAISTVPAAIIPINTFAEQTVKKYDDIIGSFKSLSELKDVILNSGNKSALTKQLKDIKVASTVVEVMEYSYQTVEFVEAVAKKDELRASEALKEIGLDVLKDTVFKGNPAKKAGLNVIVSAIENGTESYLEFCSDPTVENFGNMIYSSTLNSLDEGIMKTAYDIVENIPVVGTWMTGEYERLSGKSGVEGVIDSQRRLLNEMIESSDGFNGWVEGMELMGKGIKKGAANAKNAVVNGFKSIFT